MNVHWVLYTAGILIMRWTLFSVLSMNRTQCILPGSEAVHADLHTSASVQP